MTFVQPRMYFLRMCTCPGLPTDVQWYIGNPKLCCFGNGSVHSISFCTENCPKQSTFMMNNHRKEWTDQGCTKVPHLLHSVPTVHSIPLYHGTKWTDWDTYQSVPSATPCPHCPSHPTVPWDAHNIGSKCIFTQSKKSCSYVYLSSQMIMTLLRHVDCSLVGCQSLKSMLLILRLHHGLVGCKQLDIN